MQYAAIAAGLTAFIIYGLTCLRHPSWWNNSEDIIAAATLGIPGTPGSLILVLLGWVWSQLLFWIATPFALNLLAGLFGALTLALLVTASTSVQDNSRPRRKIATWLPYLLPVAMGLTALHLGFSDEYWRLAGRFMPYILTAVFTALILTCALKWWRAPDSPRAWLWLVLIAFLIGVDFSVHRTNSLLLPGLLVLVLMRKPKTLASGRTWLLSLGALILGLSITLALIPMSARAPYLNMSNPDSLSGLWDYLSVKQQGGGFLVQFYPRKADLFAVQFADWWQAFRNAFLTTESPVTIMGYIPGILGLLGWLALLKRNRRYALTLILLFIVTTITTVLYFNIPADYFRSLHRHYLPTFVIFSLITLSGVAALFAEIVNLSKSNIRSTLAVLLVFLAAVGVVSQLDRNYASHDYSKNSFAVDFAQGVLNNVEPNAILITGGDNDTYPLWYQVAVEHYRDDVSVINVHLLNASWYVEQLLRREPGLFGDLPDSLLNPGTPIPWSDTTVVFPVTGSREWYRLNDTAKVFDSLRFDVLPTLSDTYILQSQWLMLNLLQAQEGKRQVYLSTTVDANAVPFCRRAWQLEGLVRRFVPLWDTKPNLARLEESINEQLIIRNFDDPSVPLDWPSQMYAYSLYGLYINLAGGLRQTGEAERSAEIARSLMAKLPVDRVQPPEQMMMVLTQLANPGSPDNEPKVIMQEKKIELPEGN